MGKELKLKHRWQALGFSAREFSALLRPLAPTLTERRLIKISLGLLRPFPAEKDILSKILKVPSVEL